MNYKEIIIQLTRYYTYEQLGKVLGVSKGTISAWVHDKQVPRKYRVQDLEFIYSQRHLIVSDRSKRNEFILNKMNEIEAKNDN